MKPSLIEEIRKRETYALELEERLQGLKNVLRSTDARIQDLNTNLEIVMSDIATQNSNNQIIDFYKFKRNKQDFSVLNIQLNLLVSDRIKLQKALSTVNKLIEDNIKEYKKLALQTKSIVITGFFERKNG